MQDAIYEDQESSKQGKCSKTRWISKYKKQHKDFAIKSVKKKYCMTKRLYSSSIVGATLEVTQRKQTTKSEGREAACKAPLCEIKEPQWSFEVIDEEHVEKEMLFDNGWFYLLFSKFILEDKDVFKRKWMLRVFLY